MNGVLIVDKPKDFTSFDVVAVVRKLTKERKIGHTGTLDPLATGVLPLLIGNAAKAQSIMPDSDKEYEATFRFGITTDTLDITGNVLSKCECTLNSDNICEIINSFKGEQMQVPPMYSAVKKDGVRLYELARKGIEVEREARKVTVKEIEILGIDESEKSVRMRVLCSKGTYIRSLIDDIGKKAGCGAVMTSLRRTSACGYRICDAVSLDYLKSIDFENDPIGLLKSTESIFYSYPEIYVSQAQAVRFSNGGALDIVRTSLKRGCENGVIYRIKNNENGFLGLGITDTEKSLIKIFKLF